MAGVVRALAIASLSLPGACSMPVSLADQDEGLSLLQVSAKKQETKAHPFGCEGKGIAQSKFVCGEWGDPHRFKSGGGRDLDNNANQMGWHWLAKSADGQMQVQVFLSRAAGRLPVVSALAGRFGDTTFKVLRKGNTVRDFKLIINGELQPDRPTRRFPDGFYVQPREQKVGASVNHRYASQSGGNVAVCMDSADKRFTLRMDAYRWMGDFAGGIPINMELIVDGLSGKEIDMDFPSFCSSNEPNRAFLVSNDDIIVSPAENSELCSIEGLSDAECQDPPVVELPSDEQACLDNGIAYADAQAACESERSKGHGMFEGCVEDCCNLGSLEECTVGPEDMDNLVAEEEVDDAVSAVGDPHIKTLKKHSFDLE